MTLLVRDVCEPHVGYTGGLILEQGLSEKNCVEVTREQGQESETGRAYPEDRNPEKQGQYSRGFCGRDICQLFTTDWLEDKR